MEVSFDAAKVMVDFPDMDLSIFLSSQGIVPLTIKNLN